MLRIPCPHCGVRDEAEFRFGGELVGAPPANADDAQWADYLFRRKNVKGVQEERWCHEYGCGQWFRLVRNTLSHEILASCEMGGESPPLEPRSADGAPPK